jgi:iduronate 2-sulfatase
MTGLRFPLAGNPFPPEGSPAFAVHGDQELRSYDDCHDLPWPWEKPWDEARQRELVHGYHASVSYIDAQVGRLLDALDRLGIRENTIVVLWGDHGWKLGEHNGWCKQTNYEIDTRVPMIFSGYGVKARNRKCRALTEFVDIYPTLCEMAGLPVPEDLQGSSLVPLLSQPDTNWKKAAFSQFLLGRFGPPGNQAAGTHGLCHPDRPLPLCGVVCLEQGNKNQGSMAGQRIV